MENTTKREIRLFRMIVPASLELNVFSGFISKMTALGPVMVATSVNKVQGWRAEGIDEGNFRGPRDSQGLPDHKALQDRNPATAVGFYCGLSSAIPRVFHLAEFYHKSFAVTIAGGWHAHYQPTEMLENNIDVVVHGDGEYVIWQILSAVEKDGCFADIPGISFWGAGERKTNSSETLEVRDLDDLPHPDFGLLRHAGKIKYYPIGRIRGCDRNCEFCSVKGKPRWSSHQHLFETVNWLVETRRACRFFIVDDRLEGDLAGAIEFFKMVSERYGRRLGFTVQVRLETAQKRELLEAMKNAGVRVVCIGYESPIDEELKAMRKGYLSAKMLEWTRIWRSCGFRIHAMFIFGYPHPQKEISRLVNPKEDVKRFREFIRKSHVDTIQILLPVPLPGTALRERLIEEGRIFPLAIVPWDRYDGNSVCFLPKGMSRRELQEIQMKLMVRFYNLWAFARIPFKTIASPVDCFIWGWDRWYRHWFRDILKAGGYLLVRRWKRGRREGDFIRQLEKYQPDEHENHGI